MYGCLSGMGEMTNCPAHGSFSQGILPKSATYSTLDPDILSWYESCIGVDTPQARGTLVRLSSGWTAPRLARELQPAVVHWSNLHTGAPLWEGGLAPLSRTLRAVPKPSPQFLQGWVPFVTVTTLFYKLPTITTT